MMIRRIGALVKDAWQIAGITLLLFCLLEGLLSSTSLIKHRLGGSGQSAINPRAAADTYSNQPWVNDYYEEFRLSSVVRWEPYVYWRRKPFHGTYINIDSEGIRRTTLPKPMKKDPGTPVKIFMFGGSTLWGTGARDAFTIPSIVEKQLQDRGVDTDVTNFGEIGYVTTQEVIMLLLQLQKGQRPDFVIFYDGANDLFSAYQQDVAGLPQNEFNRVKEFNLSQPDSFKRRGKMVLQDVAQRLSTARLLRGILRKTGVWRRPAAANPLPLDNPAGRMDVLAQAVLATYKGNMDLVKALGEHYHFKYIFYWQPTVFQKEHLTEFEREQREEKHHVEQFVHRTYEVIRQSGLSEERGGSFHDLSLVFAAVREPVYLDWCHLGETGNETIAKKMASDVLDLANTTP